MKLERIHEEIKHLESYYSEDSITPEEFKFLQELKFLVQLASNEHTIETPKPLDWVYSKLKVKKGSTFNSGNISLRVCASWIEEYVKLYYK